MTAFARLVGMQAAFEAAGNPCARLDAEILLAHALGWPQLKVYTDRDHMLTAADLAALAGMQVRRLAGEPVAYIIGVQEFWGLEFAVSGDTLIPRADTETLVECALAALQGKEKPKILDLGTGTGCILIALLSERHDAVGYGYDLSAGAVALAAQNAARHGVSDRSYFASSDWFTNVETPAGGFDCIVSNPPYIPVADIASLMADVRDFEPTSALDGGVDGLDPYRVLVRQAPEYLASGGVLAVEIGIAQAADVSSLFEASGFKNIRQQADLSGVTRVISGKKSSGFADLVLE